MSLAVQRGVIAFEVDQDALEEPPFTELAATVVEEVHAEDDMLVPVAFMPPRRAGFDCPHTAWAFARSVRLAVARDRE